MSFAQLLQFVSNSNLQLHIQNPQQQAEAFLRDLGITASGQTPAPLFTIPPGQFPAPPPPPPTGGPLAVPTPANPNAFAGMTQVPNADQRAVGFSGQQPGEVFTRFLRELEGPTRFAGPVRNVLQRRGETLGSLSDLLGLAPTSEVRGQGQRSFEDFLAQNQGLTLPNQELLNQRLQLLQEAEGAPVRTQAQMAAFDPFQGESEGATTRNLFGAFQAAQTANVNPFLRAGRARQLQRAFEEQQATQPQTRFLDFARQQGWF
jgi:hypothetical protein